MRWSRVRRLILALGLTAAAGALLAHPALVARYWSGDGELARSTVNWLYALQAAALLAAGGMLLVWHRWRVATPARQRLIAGVGMLLASIMISTASAEAGLAAIHHFVRPIGAERHYFFDYDPTLGWKHRPQSAASFKGAPVLIDAHGLRVADAEVSPAPRRLLLLGDSQAFGDGVRAEDTFAAHVEMAQPGLRVLNAAVIGYGTDQQTLYFEQQAFRPDIAVLAINGYDVRDNLSTRVRSGYQKPRFVLGPDGLTLTNVPVPGDGLADRLQRALQHRSHLYRLLGRARRDAADLSDVPAVERLAAEVYPQGVHFEHGLQVTAAILDRCSAVARGRGTRLIVLFLPYQMDFLGFPAYAAQTARLTDLLAERAAADNFTFLDGRLALAAEPPATLFQDAMHLSPAGHRRVAGLLSRTLGHGDRGARHED